MRLNSYILPFILGNLMEKVRTPPDQEHLHSELDIKAIRRHFLFPQGKRIVTNNAATTQVPLDLLKMYATLSQDYENVHRGQSKASVKMSTMLEDAYDTIASFINAPGGRNCLALYRNTTEAINSVMYSLMTEFRDGDNVVTTMMEHNSNYVPWYAMCKEILPKFGVKVEYRIVNFSKETGELDLTHMAQLIDNRTKLVCCTGASNFLGVKNPVEVIRELTLKSGYTHPNGRSGSYFLVDGAQLVPSSGVDVQDLNIDFLAFSFHKMLAPFGVGVLYARESILASLPPFLYGGDMIAQGQVTPEKVSYDHLPWKYSAGTPDILGTIVSAQALRLLIDLTIDPDQQIYFGNEKLIEHEVVIRAMGKVTAHLQKLTRRAIESLSSVPGIQIYGPQDASKRTALVAFNIKGINPISLAEDLAEFEVEARGGCHCATLAHHYLGLDPPASCRLSFYIYNTLQEVDSATEAVKKVVTARKHYVIENSLLIKAN
jgi:cysteine desulfurase / selenocysteine lyase